MSLREQLRGVFVAPLMPSHEDGSADLPKWIAHCRRLLAQGSHGLMPLGSTGEAHSFTVDERLAMIDALAQSGLPMNKMLVGASALAYPDAVRLIKHATSLGAGAVCVQPHFYYKTGDDGVHAWYARLIDLVGDARLKLIIYDWESNIRVAFSLDLLGRLFGDFPGTIVGIKDSNGDKKQIEERCRAFPDRLVYSGTDVTALAGLRAGSNGCLSSYGNVMTATLVRLFDSFRSAEGDACQAALDAYIATARQFSVIAAIKQTMARLSGDSQWVNARPPIVPLTQAQTRALYAKLDAIGFDRRQAAE